MPDITFHDELSDADGREIEQWLEQDRHPGGGSHLGRFRRLKTDFGVRRDRIDRNQEPVVGFICARHQAKAVGFIFWQEHPVDPDVMMIQLCAVKPARRHNGLGRCLVNKACTKLEEEGCRAVYLECDPPESNVFWRRMGFLDFPPEHFVSDRTSYPPPRERGGIRPLCLYKIIGPGPSPLIDTNDVVELWPAAPGEPAASGDPRWRWSLPAIIVAPCDRDWRLRVTKGNTKAKLFDGFAHQTDSINNACGGFLVLFAPSAEAIVEKVRRHEEQSTHHFNRPQPTPPL